jgi:EAL domain-containing protein (putative c-di-GMP-specific phosphodiesterase class I)
MPLRQKASSARPPANSPVAPAPPLRAPGPVTVEILGQQLRDALPPRRLQSVSLCDYEANVLWLSEGALGPDEHAVVVEALALLSADTSLGCHELALEDGRHALFLAVRAPTADLVGIAMILADSRTAGDDTIECMTAAPVRAIMQRLAVLMKPGDKRAGPPGSDIPVLELSLDQASAPRPASPAPRVAPAAQAARSAPPTPASVRPPTAKPATPPRTAASAPPHETVLTRVITPAEVNDILEFELATAERPAPIMRAGGAPASVAAKATAAPVRAPPAHPDETSSMMRLGFTDEPPASLRANPPVLTAAAPSARPTRNAPPPSPSPVAPRPTAKTHAAAGSPAPRAPAAAPTPPRPAVEPAAPATAATDRSLKLELLPFAKLRPGGQSRRFQVLAHASPRDAQRDPASLDGLVLQRLLAWLAAHRAAWNSQPTSFTLNLSIATLEDERFPQRVAAALNSSGLAAETLGFEIAEALCTQRRAQVERFIGQCDKLGSWVAIDDFSFDSQVLPLLRSKALRLVKLDAKLTTSALKDKLSQALVVATVQAAKVMGIHCAAKGVDSRAAAQWLGAIGCDFAQGAAVGGAHPIEALVSASDAAGLPRST